MIRALNPLTTGCSEVLAGPCPGVTPAPPDSPAPFGPPPWVFEPEGDWPPERGDDPAAGAAWVAASAAKARLKTMTRRFRNRSLSSAYGVSCRAGAERACASRGFTAGFAPGLWVPRSAGFVPGGLGVAGIYKTLPPDFGKRYVFPPGGPPTSRRPASSRRPAALMAPRRASGALPRPRRPAPLTAPPPARGALRR